MFHSRQILLKIKKKRFMQTKGNIFEEFKNVYIFLYNIVKATARFPRYSVPSESFLIKA